MQDAKNSVRDQLIAAGGAYKYAEPEKEVMSRSGNECVVALTDQWYIKYGEDQWKAQIETHMKRMNLYNDDIRSGKLPSRPARLSGRLSCAWFQPTPGTLSPRL